MLAGSTVRPVSDRHRVSHEELSYIVDSTASPVATVLPFNAWPAYVAGVTAGATTAAIGDYVLIPDEDAGIRFFFGSIWYNFYGLLAVVGTLLFSLGLLPFVGGKMRRAIERSRKTGQLDAHGARPLVDLDAIEGTPEPGYPVGLADFLVPLGLAADDRDRAAGVLQGEHDQPGIPRQHRRRPWSSRSLKGMPLKTAMDGYLDGCKNMTVGAIILGLAVTLGQVSKDLDTAGFVVSLVRDWMPAVPAAGGPDGAPA